jgi:hypothetical protein
MNSELRQRDYIIEDIEPDSDTDRESVVVGGNGVQVGHLYRFNMPERDKRHSVTGYVYEINDDVTVNIIAVLTGNIFFKIISA